MKDHALAAFLLGALLFANDGVAFTNRPTFGSIGGSQRRSLRSTLSLSMQPGNFESSEDSSAYSPTSTSLRQRRDQQLQLRAIAIGSLSDDGEEATNTDNTAASLSFSETKAVAVGDSGLLQVLSAASLVTGSTVGAGMLILPSLAAGPGFAISSALFLGIYFLVLTSGLVIADVAINQHESGYDVPSSFQEFAEANLESEWIAKGVSAIPVVVNSLIMVFTVSKAGDLGSSLLSSFVHVDVDPIMASVGFVGILGVILSTLSGTNLSKVASMCVTALLVSFGGLLLPGLSAVQDPLGTLLAPGLDGDQWFASVAAAAPICLTALQFQNVVPSLTKILKYDRQKTVAAIALGSFTPLAMYLAWCFAVLGGGLDSAGGIAGPLMTVFSATTLLGSSLGGAMSVTEEVETFVSKASAESEDPAPKKDVFSLPAVLLSLAVPMAGVVAFSGGNDASAALGVAGSFGTPILYGVIPAMMAMNQRKKNDIDAKSLVPGGLAGVGALGLAAAVYVGGGLASQVTEILSVSS